MARTPPLQLRLPADVKAALEARADALAVRLSVQDGRPVSRSQALIRAIEAGIDALLKATP